MSLWIPTARNSERWKREDEKAQRYLKPGAPTPVDTRLQHVRDGLALRHAYRIERDFRVRRDGSPREQLLQRLLTCLLGVREAESILRLTTRDRILGQIIAGIVENGALNVVEVGLLMALRTDALTRRQAELQKGGCNPCTN